MSALPLVLVLSSAVLHASWNLVVKSSNDRLLAGWAQVVAAALVMSPLVVLNPIPARILPFVALSAAVHTLYISSLVAAYERGELSLVYPVARGTAPLIVTIAAATLLDDIPSAGGIAAILLVVIGILWLARGTNTNGLGWALVTAVTIASYTLIDGASVRTLDTAVGYTGAVFIGNAILLTPTVLVRRGFASIRQILIVEGGRNLLGGAASAAAYVLVLVAARLAPLGLVSAFRETSVVIGALAGWLVLSEPDGLRRLRGASLVAVGLGVLVFIG
ncbi:MAG: EamA family transporter [Acidimicrobiia bacterium]|nr:EamA family transporter [Acidimicrobiia bacterium]